MSWRASLWILPTCLLQWRGLLSLWSIFYPSFSNIIPSFHTISSHKTRQDKQDTIHCTWLTNLQDYKQDLQLVLFSNSRSPTVTAYLPESFHMHFVLFVMLPQEESLTELSLSSSAGWVNQGLRPLLSSGINISST